jgi:energy-coupling factor transporter ATP-binding protein EcfA2
VLDRVSFKNFKSLKAVTIDLAPLTVLVGPNGSGKSSVLLGIHLLSRTGIRQPHLGNIWGRFSITFSGSLAPRRLASVKGPATVELSAREAGGDTLTLGIEVPATSEEEPAKLVYSATVDGPAGHYVAAMPRQDFSAGGSDETLLDHPRIKGFASVVYLHLDPNVMCRTSTTDEEEPRMRPDGDGLASNLAWLAGAKPEVLQWVAAALRRVVPGVRRILVHRERIVHRDMETITVDGQPVWRPINRTTLGDRFSIEFDDGTEVPADLLSEGTVLALGLLTKLHEPERPRVLLLDDIDRGLHIGAQAKLVAVLRDLMKLDPELQIICTTHSAYLLDLFDPSEVRVLALDTSRATHAQPLTAHPEFEKWRFGTQTGELWAALGDAWVTKHPEDPTP